MLQSLSRTLLKVKPVALSAFDGEQTSASCDVMAAASVTRPGSAQTTEKSQLILKVVSAKPQSPKLPNRHSRLSSFVEVTADGLTSETKKTGKRSGHLELQWNEDLTL
ncbi:NEDD4-like E3 ubiquitin-protein ligase wwp2 [Ilyodon furcidens]|uniref:NEDD4-like E3 ubiquitin-protein ligase wwp2 n=1 Tax=Ilyodon furcidens TaxID=33524 RepID=A0ABV0U8G4_9TELE